MKDCRTKVVYQDEVCSEERAIEFKVKKQFGSTEAVWGSTLYDINDLPYDEDLMDLPDTFTPFRNKVEKKCTIKQPLNIPKQLPFPSFEDFPVLESHATYMPTLEDLGYTQDQIEQAGTVDSRGVMEFKG